MVLETLTNPFDAEMHPGKVFIHGMLYAFLGMFLALWLFKEYASIVSVFLIAGASIPLLYNLIKYEEEKDMTGLNERMLIKEHSRAITVYFMLFLGITAAMSLAFIFMPEGMIGAAFEAQISTYQSINPSRHVVGQLTGNAITGGATGMEFFSHIFLNNIKVLIFCIMFSFLYGAGAIFILVWNGSVIALAIGNTLRMKAATLASATGMPVAAAYLQQTFKTVVLRYGIHGSMEIIAYMMAGLAGGIISVAVIRHHFTSKKFEHVVIDSADLILLSIAILFVAGMWEAFITPAFY